jgi:hypothetical protein
LRDARDHAQNRVILNLLAAVAPSEQTPARHRCRTALRSGRPRAPEAAATQSALPRESARERRGPLAMRDQTHAAARGRGAALL